ncbi:MAG: biotin--[acetyl-CoA-carboxylase] ligase [Deltaproteobacteria bacterium]|nr:biotin--[acetyl-CoA-carboxylase] ligase [Deltaproteobacteria bacterium]
MTGIGKRIFQNHEFRDFSEVYGHEPGHSAGIFDLNTEFMGTVIHYYREISSTSVKAFDLAHLGAAEGTVVVAESQSRGKGRRGRVWLSPGGKNIYTSIILRPPLAPPDAPKLTLVAAVALAETISSFVKGTSIECARIKWPNDILLGKKKCAGILTEMKCNGNDVDFVVIGIGINVNMKEDHMPPDLLSPATSMSMEAGQLISRGALLRDLYRNIESWYKRYLLEGFLPVREKWNALSGIGGMQVRAASGMHDYEEGRAMGINDDGSLLLEKQDGSLINVTVGDINIL